VKKLPTVVEHAIIAEYRSGLTMNDIAHQRAIHRTTVAVVSDRAGISRRPKGMTAEQIRLAADLYGCGLSLAAVGSRLGSSASTIRAELMKISVRIRPRPGR